VLIRPCPVG